MAEDRDCESCVNYDGVSCRAWECDYINRDELIEMFREKKEEE